MMMYVNDQIGVSSIQSSRIPWIKHTGVLKARSFAQVAYRCRPACIIAVKDGRRLDQISFVCIAAYHRIF